MIAKRGPSLDRIELLSGSRFITAAAATAATTAAIVSTLAALGCGRLGFEEEGAAPDGASQQAEILIGDREGASEGLIVDTTIKDYEPANNYVSAGFLGAFAPLNGVDSTPGLIRFNLESLAGKVFDRATLEVATNLDVDDIFEGETIAIINLLEPWVGAETTFNSRMAGFPGRRPGLAEQRGASWLRRSKQSVAPTAPSSQSEATCSGLGSNRPAPTTG